MQELSPFGACDGSSVCVPSGRDHLWPGYGFDYGTVQDQTTAVVPAADVVISNPSRGIERKIQTNAAGLFTSPALVPADGYLGTVTKTGFSKFELKNFTLQVGQAMDLNVALEVAAAGTEVSVTGQAPLVEG